MVGQRWRHCLLQRKEGCVFETEMIWTVGLWKGGFSRPVSVQGGGSPPLIRKWLTITKDVVSCYKRCPPLNEKLIQKQASPTRAKSFQSCIQSSTPTANPHKQPNIPSLERWSSLNSHQPLPDREIPPNDPALEGISVATRQPSNAHFHTLIGCQRQPQQDAKGNLLS